MNFIRRFYSKKGSFILTLVILAVVGYFIYERSQPKTVEAQYITAPAEKGTLSVTVSATGQVSSSNQIDIKPESSGKITSINVKPGQEISQGASIATLDSKDAQKAIRDAEVNLQTAKLALEKLQKPTDSLSITQAQNTLERNKQAKLDAQDDLNKAYEDGFTEVSNAFLDLPDIMTGLQDTLYDSTPSLDTGGRTNMDFYTDEALKYDDKAVNYKLDADAKYKLARASYDKTFDTYKSTSRTASSDVLEKLITETYTTTKNISEAVKSANNLIQFYKDKLTEKNFKPVNTSLTQLTTLGGYTSTVNSNLSSLLGITNTIKTSKDAITNSDRTIQENTESLAKLNEGADELDVQSAQITITQRQNALRDAREALSDYSITAPIDGVIATVDGKVGDNAASATALATIIAKQQIAEVSLNEVDVAKVKAGQKATLTFDAIENLSITGTVAEVGSLGTATQGVVNYTVKITFDTQDPRVKPGMSASVNIILSAKTNALLVPSSAVKTQGNTSYVEILVNGNPVQKNVTVGDSSDTSTEILTGLTENEEVITQTITSTTATQGTTTGSQRTGGNVFFGGGGGVQRAVGGGGAGR